MPEPRAGARAIHRQRDARQDGDPRRRKPTIERLAEQQHGAGPGDHGNRELESVPAREAPSAGRTAYQSA